MVAVFFDGAGGDNGDFAHFYRLVDFGPGEFVKLVNFFYAGHGGFLLLAIVVKSVRCRYLDNFFYRALIFALRRRCRPIPPARRSRS